MYCSKCGTELPESAAFCSNCGQRTGQAAAQTAEQEPVISAYDRQISGTEQEKAAAQFAQMGQPGQPGQEASGQPAQTAPGQINEQPAQTAPGQTNEQLAQTAFVQQQQSYYAQEQPGQPQVQFIQPVTAPPKKKSKKGLAIGLGCGGAALIGAGVLTYSLATSAVMRTVMGDTEYAKSVNSNYVIGELSEYTGLAETAADATAKYAGTLGNIGSLIGGGAAYSGANYGGGNDDTESLYDKYDYSTIAIAQTFYRYYALLDLYGGDGLTLTASADTELKSELAKVFGASDLGQYMGDFAEVANTSEITFAFREVSDILNISIQADRNDSYFIGTLMQLDENGNLTVYLPEASQRAMKYKLPARREMEGEVPARGRLDIEKLKKLYSELKKAYYDCYEFAVITYEDGECDFGETTEKCTVITVKFDAEGIAKIFEKFAGVFENDDTLSEMFPSAYYSEKGGLSKMLAELLREGNKNFYENSAGYSHISLTSVSYVNAQNKALGVQYTIVYDKDTDGKERAAVLTSVDNGKTSRTSCSADERKFFELVNSKNGNSGSAELLIYPVSDPDDCVKLCIDYSDMRTFTALGKSMLGGTYTIYAADTPYMKKTLDYKLNEQTSAYDVFSGIKFTVSAEPSGSGVVSTGSVSHDRYGHITVKLDIQPSGIIPEAPAGCTFFDPLKEQGEGSEMAYDLYNYLYGKIESDPALMKLDGDVEKMTGTGLIGGLTKLMKDIEDQRAFREKYSGYTSSTPYYASMAASNIYNYACRSSINDTVCIKLWYDSDGTLTVLDAAGQNAADISNTFTIIDNSSYYRGIMSNIYAEVWFSSDYLATGVTAVKCNSPDSIPADLPNRYDFLARTYPWEYENMIDGWAVGTSPALETGDRADVEELLAKAESYKDLAKTIYDAYYDYTKSSGNSVSLNASYAFDVYFTLTKDGKVTSFGARRIYDDRPDDTSKLFTKEDITESGSGFIKALEALKLNDADDRAFKLTFMDGMIGMTGVVVFDRDAEIPPLSAEYFLFYGVNDAPWDSNIAGIYYGHPVGTYPEAGGSIELYEAAIGQTGYMTLTDGLSDELLARLDEYNVQAKEIYGAYMEYEAESGNKPALKDPFRIIFTVDAEGIVSYEPGGAYTWQDQEPESITGWFTGEDISAQGNGLEKKLTGLGLTGDNVRYAVFYYHGNSTLGGVAISDHALTAESLPLDYFSDNIDYDRLSLWTGGIVGFSRYPSLDLDVVCGTYPYMDITAGTWDMSTLSSPDDPEGNLSVAMWSYGDAALLISYANDIAEFEINSSFPEKAEYLDYLTKAVYGQGYGEYATPDIFVLEPSDLPYFIDYALTDEELGLTAEDTRNMFVYTKRFALNYDGKMAAFAPLITPGGFVYRKDIARKVLGTDDPYEVGEMIKGWDNFEAVAKKMKDSGYYMVPDTDTLLRAFIQNAEDDVFVDTDSKTLSFDLQDWLDLAKRLTDSGCTPQCGAWYGDWMKEHTADGTTFGDFMPLWGTGDQIYESGEWAVCAPPVEYSWGGLYFCVSKTCRNKELAGKVIKRIICDNATQETIGRQFKLAMPNNITVMSKLCGDENYIAGIKEASSFADEKAMKLYYSCAMTFEPRTPEYPEDMLVSALTNGMLDYFLGKESYENAFDKVIAILFSDPTQPTE